MKKSFFQNSTEPDDYWISVSDIMSGLMMVFLLIAVVFMLDIQDKTNEIERVQRNICDQIRSEFQNQKERWNMSICDGGLVVSFQNDAVFDKGSAKLKPRFKKILNEFFPKFMKIVIANQSKISELRIEGHTSSEYTKQSKDKSYVLNTRLSQGRSFNVMDYIFSVSSTPLKSWMNGNLTAHGMSSSNLIYKDNEGLVEDRKKSRRVEFRIQTNAEAKLIEDLKLKINQIQPINLTDLTPNADPYTVTSELPPLTDPAIDSQPEPTNQNALPPLMDLETFNNRSNHTSSKSRSNTSSSPTKVQLNKDESCGFGGIYPADIENTFTNNRDTYECSGEVILRDYKTKYVGAMRLNKETVAKDQPAIQAHGYGKLYFPDGSVLYSRWENGISIDPKELTTIEGKFHNDEIIEVIQMNIPWSDSTLFRTYSLPITPKNKFQTIPALTEKTDNEPSDNVELKEAEDEESWFTKKPKLVPSKPQIGM